jgi:hypothetical protein
VFGSFTVLQLSGPGQAIGACPTQAGSVDGNWQQRGRHSTGTEGAACPDGMVFASNVGFAAGPGAWQFAGFVGPTISTTARLPCE